MKNNADTDSEIANIFEHNKYDISSKPVQTSSKLENKNNDSAEYDVSDDSLNGLSLPSVSAPVTSR